MFKFYSILLLIAFSAETFGIDAENQQLVHPLCGTQGPSIWVADPTSCHTYLFCQWNDTVPTHLIAVHQIDCRNQNSNHFVPNADFTGGSCVDERTHCSNSSFFCPTGDLMVANPADPECREYRPCRLPGFPWMSCRAPLVFNRNTGGCDHASNAPCSPPVVNVECPPVGNGKFPGRNCWSYLFCFEGTEHGQFECPSGWKFDEAEADCVEDTAGTCIRPSFDFEVPKVKNGVIQKAKKGITVTIEGL